MLFPTGLRRPLAIFAALAGFLIAPASASDSLTTRTLEGTPGWAIDEMVLRDGPSGAYPINGAVPAETRIIIDRCHYRWCKVRYGHDRGWMNMANISFGQHPRGPFTGPRLNYASGGGEVCFFTGKNFTGTSVCAKSGTVIHDLKLYGMDDAFASVEVHGAANVMVCRDFDYASYCTRITRSQPVLGRYLYRAVSSYRVY